MLIAFRVTIQDKVHIVRVWVPAYLSREERREVEDFAVSTAVLECSGYLPRNIASAVA